MTPWNSRLRKLRPFKRFNDKLRTLKNNILESTCLPIAGDLLCFDEKPLRDNRVAGQHQQEKANERRLPELGRAVSRFNEGSMMTSWLGVIPQRGPVNEQGGEAPPGQEDDQRQYHYRLRRIHLLDDQDDEELEEPPFITPIPSVKLDTPTAPRKSEGTYSRYYAMFDRGLDSNSFDDYRPLSLDRRAGAADKAAEKAKRHPKLEVIFGQDNQDFFEVSDPRKQLFAGDLPRDTTTSTGSKYKYAEETERNSTEIFMTAGIDHSITRFFAGQSNDDSRNIDYSRFYNHRNESLLHLPSIDSDTASADILSQPRFDEKLASLNSGSATSQDLDDAQPISVSISRLGSSFFSYTPTAKLPAAPPNTPWDPTATGEAGLQENKPEHRPNTTQQPTLMPNALTPEDYSFISFSTPSRLSLAIPSTLPEIGKKLAVSSHPQSEIAARVTSTHLANQDTRAQSHLGTGKTRLPSTEKKSVRIVEEPEVWPTTKPNQIRFVNGSMAGGAVIEPATSFARDLNKALDALDQVATTVELTSGLSSNAADKVAFKAKLDGDGLEFSATLPPSALLSPVSKFSEGSTLNYEDPEPLVASPPRRRRKFGIPVKQTNGVALTRTKTRHYRDRQLPLVYRKLLDMYSLQYQNY